MKISEHQQRLWQQMIEVIEDYRSGRVVFPEMVGRLEGALDAGDFRNTNLRECWYDLWTPLEIIRATEDGIGNGSNIDEYVSRMKEFLEEVLADR